MTDKSQTRLSSRDRLERFLECALAYQGHRANANLVSGFGEKVGYGSQPWAGSFIDVVAREAGLLLPACVQTNSAIAEFLRAGRIRTTPKRGDLAFFAFAGEGSGSPFEMPHIGIVTDVSRYSQTGSFQVLEAQTSSGLPRGIPDANGVFLRVRNQNDVLMFARPDYRAATSTLSNKLNVDGLPVVNLAQATSGRPNRATEVVQLALVTRVGLRAYKPGTLDAATRASVARFQRAIGRVGSDAAGNLDRATLTRLSSDTRMFVVV